MAAYVIQFNKTDLLAATLLSGATSTTLTNGNFGSPSGVQIYVVDYDVPAKAEIISASVTTTAVTGITRGLTGGAAGTTDHQIGAKVGVIFVPQHYDRVATRTLGYAQITTSFTTTAVSTATDVGLSIAVTVPVGGARVRITGYCALLDTSATSGTTIDLFIQEGATVLSAAEFTGSSSADGTYMNCQASFVATAGSHTYKLTGFQSAAGTLRMFASATQPAFILVENIE